jgi:flagellin-like protein
MARFRRSSRALSEIVGSLMLVLIVVVAATALAVFVQSYQKNLQAEQALAQAKSLESLKVLRVAPTLNGSSLPGATTWQTLNFTVASLYVNPAIITELTLDGNPVRNFTAWHLDLGTGNWTEDVVGGGGQLTLFPREQAYIQLDTQGAPETSFYNPAYQVATSASINLQLLTSYQNVFTGLFIPPTAVPLVQTLQTWDAMTSSYVQVPLLDGSNSFQTGNLTIDNWTWSITPGPITLWGEKQVASTLNSVTTYTIRLTVTNTEGLQGVDAITYV